MASKIALALACAFLLAVGGGADPSANEAGSSAAELEALELSIQVLAAESCASCNSRCSACKSCKVCLEPGKACPQYCLTTCAQKCGGCAHCAGHLQSHSSFAALPAVASTVDEAAELSTQVVAAESCASCNSRCSACKSCKVCLEPGKTCPQYCLTTCAQKCGGCAHCAGHVQSYSSFAALPAPAAVDEAAELSTQVVAAESCASCNSRCSACKSCKVCLEPGKTCPQYCLTTCAQKCGGCAHCAGHVQSYSSFAALTAVAGANVTVGEAPAPAQLAAPSVEELSAAVLAAESCSSCASRCGACKPCKACLEPGKRCPQWCTTTCAQKCGSCARCSGEMQGAEQTSPLLRGAVAAVALPQELPAPAAPMSLPTAAELGAAVLAAESCESCGSRCAACKPCKVCLEPGKACPQWCLTTCAQKCGGCARCNSPAQSLAAAEPAAVASNAVVPPEAVGQSAIELSIAVLAAESCSSCASRCGACKPCKACLEGKACPQWCLTTCAQKCGSCASCSGALQGAAASSLPELLP